MGSILSVSNVEIDDHIIKLKPLKRNSSINIQKQDNINNNEKVNLENIKAAEKILEEAKIKAQGIIKEAEKKAQKIKNDTYKESKEEGYREGYKESIKTATCDVYTKYKDILNQCEDEINNIIKYRENIFEDIEKQAIDLALLISGKILNYEISNNADVMKGILDKVVKDYVNTGNEKIYVSMKNKYILTENNELLKKMLSNEISLNIIESKDINDIECVIENEKGKLDIGIESQFKQMSSVLYNAVSNY